MTLAMPRIRETIVLEEGRTLQLREATEPDMDAIKHLYFTVYGGRYSLPEVTDVDKMKWAIHDPNYIWILVEDEEARIVSSVIFVVDQQARLGKTFAGVVDPDYRGHSLLVRTLERGLEILLEGDKPICDLIYAVVRTFTPLSFHEDLKSVGFVDMGVFPNVRKVKKYETHGLKVRFSSRALDLRRQTPSLITATKLIYDVARPLLGLEEADVRESGTRRPSSTSDGRFQFMIHRAPEVEWEYYRVRDEGELLFDFFPLHYPHLKLYTRDERHVVFIHFLETDGHACILGIKTDASDLAAFLLAVGEMAESIGIKYLELLVSAYDADMQQTAYDANFLPCAYFPAMQLDDEGRRQDYIVTSCTFMAPHFRGLTLSPDTRPYVQAFYKVYVGRLWEEIQDN
ncbi:MAG TPA: hypothetical protein VGO93_05965 [Candidatus Xenobia bacterium]